MQTASATVITDFIESIGIPIQFRAIEEDTFLPGVFISHGSLIVDVNKLKHPGDLLHEAGHIAVLTPEERATEHGSLVTEQKPEQSREIAVICWTWAAIVKTGIDPEVVFHPEGYKGANDWLIEQFQNGTYIGLPLLEYYGLCAGPRRAAETGVPPFPHMLKWLR